ncbi:MAG: F0F1 ATP synthase subunit epsilon [Pseudomonadota bacterium]
MRLSVTTPHGAVVETEIDEVTAPGLVGEFGVLAGHVPLMAALKPGVLSYRAGDATKALAVGEGFLQVTPAKAGETTGTGSEKASDRVLVLVTEALAAGAIDAAAAKKSLAEAEAEIAAWKREPDGTYQALLAKRDWALAQIGAAGRVNPS